MQMSEPKNEPHVGPESASQEGWQPHEKGQSESPPTPATGTPKGQPDSGRHGTETAAERTRADPAEKDG